MSKQAKRTFSTYIVVVCVIIDVICLIRIAGSL